MNYKNILTEADKSRFIKPIYDDIKSRYNTLPSEEDLITFANNGAADKYKIDWQKLKKDLDEQDKLINSYKAYKTTKEQDADLKTQFLKRSRDFIILDEIENWLFVGVLSYNGAKYCDSFNCNGSGAKWCIGYKKTNIYWLEYTSGTVPNSVFVLALDKDNFAGENCKYMLQLKTRDHVECREVLAWDQVDDCYNVGRTDLPSDLDEDYIEEHNWVEIISKKMSEINDACPNYTKWMSDFSNHYVPIKVDNETDNVIDVQGLDFQIVSLSLLTQWLEPINHNKDYHLRYSNRQGEIVIPRIYLLPSEYVKADYKPRSIILQAKEVRIGDFTGSMSTTMVNVEADTLKVNMLSVTKADYEVANSPQIAFGKTFNEKDEEFNNVARLLFHAGINCYGTPNIQINELKLEQKLTENKEKKFHMKAADLAEKISSITNGKDPYDFGVVLVNDDMVSLLRSVKANTDIECILLSNVHWEDSFDGYSSVDVDELIDALRNYPNYDIIYSIDKKPPKYVSEIETSPNEDMVDILIGGDEFFDPLTSATASPLLLN